MKPVRIIVARNCSGMLILTKDEALILIAGDTYWRPITSIKIDLTYLVFPHLELHLLAATGMGSPSD
jgi:hypothetical protein